MSFSNFGQPNIRISSLSGSSALSTGSSNVFPSGQSTGSSNVFPSGQSTGSSNVFSSGQPAPQAQTPILSGPAAGFSLAGTPVTPRLARSDLSKSPRTSLISSNNQQSTELTQSRRYTPTSETSELLKTSSVPPEPELILPSEMLPDVVVPVNSPSLAGTSLPKIEKTPTAIFQQPVEMTDADLETMCSTDPNYQGKCARESFWERRSRMNMSEELLSLKKSEMSWHKFYLHYRNRYTQDQTGAENAAIDGYILHLGKMSDSVKIDYEQILIRTLDRIPMESFMWIYETHKTLPFEAVSHYAAIYGRSDILEWFVRNGYYIVLEDYIDDAIQGGQATTLQLLKTRSVLIPDQIRDVGWSGKIEFLIWLRENGYKFNTYSYLGIHSNHLQVYEWLRNLGIQPTSQVFDDLIKQMLDEPGPLGVYKNAVSWLIQNSVQPTAGFFNNLKEKLVLATTHDPTQLKNPNNQYILQNPNSVNVSRIQEIFKTLRESGF